jgi:hypothetical protein
VFIPAHPATMTLSTMCLFQVRRNSDITLFSSQSLSCCVAGNNGTVDIHWTVPLCVSLLIFPFNPLTSSYLRPYPLSPPRTRTKNALFRRSTILVSRSTFFDRSQCLYYWWVASLNFSVLPTFLFGGVFISPSTMLRRTSLSA